MYLPSRETCPQAKGMIVCVVAEEVFSLPQQGNDGAFGITVLAT